MEISVKPYKKITQHRFLIFSIVLLGHIFLLVGCSSLEIKSSWREREIVVDGKSEDWLGALYYLEEENISFGLLNDEDYFYICMIAEDRFVRAQVMWQGLSLWFDPDGGKEKTFGIRFPLGRKEKGEELLMSMREERDQEKLLEAFEQSLADLEILGPGKDLWKRIAVDEAKGIDIILKASTGVLVYELKVPLLHDEQYPYAVGAKAGDLIGLGIEIPKMDRSAMRERMGGRPGGGGIPGGGVGGGGRIGGMGMRGGQRPQIPNGLKVWLAVQLASKDNPDSGYFF